MYFEDLNKKQDLLPGQQVQFKQSHGTIHQLELFDDHIALNFVGNVSGLESGDSDHRTSLMPSYLQWVNSKVNLSWIVIGILAVAGAVIFITHSRNMRRAH